MVERVAPGGQAIGRIEFEEAVDLVGEEVDAALGERVGERTDASSRGTSSDQPSRSWSSWRVTSAPVAPATS